MWTKEERDVTTTYPAMKPARCNENTASITTPNSLDNIVFMAIHGDASKPNDELTSTDDLRRTIFSEKTLIKETRMSEKISAQTIKKLK